MGRKGVFLSAAAVAAVAVLSVMFWLRSEQSAPASAEKVARQEKKPAVGAGLAKKAKNAPKRSSAMHAKPAVSVDDGLGEADRKIVARIQKVLDEEDLGGLREVFGAAAASTNAAVRLEMVEALGWFGTKAMVELVSFIEDSDEDVREAARSNLDMAIGEIDDEGTKAMIVEEALLGVTDQDFAETLAGHFNGMDEKLAVETIIRIVGSGSKAGAKAAKESYEFITGEEFTTPAAARDWIRNEYVPPED